MANGIEEFMGAIRELESGGNYQIQGVEVTSGRYRGERAYGAYQIMPGNWAAWSRAAGLAGADIRDKAAQDAVARHIMEGYYRELGDWDLVAVAWFAGLGRARQVAREGLDVASGVADDNGTSVPAYVKRIRSLMGKAPRVDAGSNASDPWAGVQPLEDVTGTQPPNRFDAATALSNMFDTVSRAIAGGNRRNINEVAPLQRKNARIDPLADLREGMVSDEEPMTPEDVATPTIDPRIE